MGLRSNSRFSSHLPPSPKLAMERDFSRKGTKETLNISQIHLVGSDMKTVKPLRTNIFFRFLLQLQETKKFLGLATLR